MRPQMRRIADGIRTGAFVVGFWCVTAGYLICLYWLMDAIGQTALRLFGL